MTKEEIDVQRNRYCLDYLPAFPPLSTITAASAVPASLPPKPAYNDEAIVVILQYLREQNQFKLFKHVLDTSLHTAKASHASWLAAYLSLPAKDSHLLMRPLRIAPEWFRVAFAYSAKQRGRWASRFARSLRDAHASAQQLADAIVAAEIARGTPVTRRSPQARAIVPTPAFAADPRSLRMLRNASVFVVSHDLKALYHDIDGLEALVARSLEVEGARQQRR